MRGIARLLSLMAYGLGIIAAIRCGMVVSEHPFIGSLFLLCSLATISLGYYIWDQSKTFSIW